MQTCTHLRSLFFNIYNWKPHAGGFQIVNSDKARQHYRLHDMPVTSSSAGSSNRVVQSQLAEVVAEAADAANSQRYSWCPVPGQQFLRRTFSSGSKIVEPAWLSLLPQVFCEGNTWLYVKIKTVAGIPAHAPGFVTSLTSLKSCPVCIVLPYVQRQILRVVKQPSNTRIMLCAASCTCCGWQERLKMACCCNGCC